MNNLRLYALALRLYPASFRARYADEMLNTARHEYARSSNPLRYTASLAADTLRGNTDHSEFRGYVFALLFEEKIQFKTT